MMRVRRTERISLFLAATLLCAAVLVVAPCGAQAQVMVLVNGSPVTALDIAQRIKLKTVTDGKAPARDAVIKELIDDHLKVFIARRYGLEVTDGEVDAAFANMARRGRLSAQQMEQSLTQRGVAMATLRGKIRADLAWSQLVRGRFGSSLQIGDGDIANVLKSKAQDDKSIVGYIYKLYPIVVIAPKSAGDAVVEAKRREAENLRSRFQNCAEGMRLARALRDVAVKEPIMRSSSDLAPALRDMLGSIEVGRLTSPETTTQGHEMYAICEKKETKAESPAKNAARDEIFAQKFEAESKKFLDEVRRQAMIEYR